MKRHPIPLFLDHRRLTRYREILRLRRALQRRCADFQIGLYATHEPDGIKYSYSVLYLGQIYDTACSAPEAYSKVMTLRRHTYRQGLFRIFSRLHQ